jgi:hypothetical protein
MLSILFESKNARAAVALFNRNSSGGMPIAFILACLNYNSIG